MQVHTHKHTHTGAVPLLHKYVGDLSRHCPVIYVCDISCKIFVCYVSTFLVPVLLVVEIMRIIPIPEMLYFLQNNVATKRGGEERERSGGKPTLCYRLIGDNTWKKHPSRMFKKRGTSVTYCFEYVEVLLTIRGRHVRHVLLKIRGRIADNMWTTHPSRDMHSLEKSLSKWQTVLENSAGFQQCWFPNRQCWLLLPITYSESTSLFLFA